MQNGFVESSNGHMRDELLNKTLFLNLNHARDAISVWTRTAIFSARTHRSFTSHRLPSQLISPQQAINCATSTCSANRLLLNPRLIAGNIPRLYRSWMTNQGQVRGPSV